MGLYLKSYLKYDYRSTTQDSGLAVLHKNGWLGGLAGRCRSRCIIMDGIGNGKGATVYILIPHTFEPVVRQVLHAFFILEINPYKIFGGKNENIDKQL